MLDAQIDSDLIVASLQEADVLRDSHDTVRVMPSQISPNQAACNHTRICAGNLGRNEELGCEVGQVGRRDGRHFASPEIGFLGGRSSEFKRLDLPDSNRPSPPAICIPVAVLIESGTRALVADLRVQVRVGIARVRTPKQHIATGKGSTMGYRIGTQTRGRQTIHTLHDDVTGASASVLPSFGFNLFDLRLPLAGEVRPILVAAEDFAENPRGAGGNGTPILFPYPNRVRNATFSYQGKKFDLPATNGANAIHGFAVDAPWEVVEHKADADSASISGRYQITRDTPAMSGKWPTDAILLVHYRLTGRRLTMTITVSNPTATDLPYGFGIHPYFRLPFAPGGHSDRTRVILPASRFWVLEEFLPTGEVRPVDARLDFRKGQPMTGLKLDDVLTGLDFEGDHGLCRLVDLDKQAEFRLGFDRSFRELVVYTPPGRGDVISLEPYTQTTDAINLQARGVDAGLRVLGHGGQHSMVLTMETLG